MRKRLDLVTRRAFILIAFCWIHFQTAYALDVNGVIDTDTHWILRDSPINIMGDVRVEMGTTLTIGPGVKVIFQPSPDISQGYSIRIDGTLIARGNRYVPILFTAADKSMPWGAIVFSDTSRDWDQDSATGSVIEYCVIEYGGNEPTGRGMITTFDAMPLIARNAIRFGVASGVSALVSEDPAVIFSLSGGIRILSNCIYNNETGIRLSAEGGGIEDNYLINNNRAMDLQIRSNALQIINNTVFSSASELIGTGIRLLFDEAANGIAAYQWRQTSGPRVSLNNPRSARATFMAPDPGSNIETLSFELKVTDKNGFQVTDTVEITVIGNNPPPVARAGGDQNVRLPREEGEEVIVTLSGTGSSDPYLGIATYEWNQTEGKSADLQGEDTISPTFTVPSSVSAGDRMSFELTVTDQGGLTSTDTVDIVYYENNIFPVANAGDDQSVSQGDTVVLDGSGSSDVDGSISAYIWVQTEGTPVYLFNPSTARPYFVAPVGNMDAETLVFRLQVIDDGGLQTFDDISVMVNTSLIADSGDDQTVNAGSDVILDGSASADQNAFADIDIKSNILELDNAGGGLIALTAVESASFQIDISRNNFNAVDYEGYLVYVYDWYDEESLAVAMPDNWWGTDDLIIIEGLIYDKNNNYKLPAVEYHPFLEEVISGAGSSLPYPPLADAGPDLDTAADNSVTLDGSNSYDPDGIATFQWKQVDGPEVNLKNSEQPIAEFIAPSGGIDGADLQFELTVSTDETFSHSDMVNVTVRPDEALPTVDVGGCFIQSAESGFLGDFLFPALLSGSFLWLTMMFGILCCFRRIITIAYVLPAVLIGIAVPAQAGYLSVGGGSGGDADEVNVTIETGAKDIHVGDLDLLFGIGIHFIPHSDNELPGSTISLPCPNNECIRIGKARKGTEVGFFGKFGVEIGTSDFYVSAIGGFTAYTESTLSQSPATGRVYEESSDSEIEALYGGGIGYFIDYKWNVILQIDYDNIRGVTGTIGWHW